LSDVGLLAEHFLRGIAEQEGHSKTFTPEALDQLARYAWPGNVRELRNAVHRAYVMAQGTQIDAQWLPAAVDEQMSVASAQEAPAPQSAVHPAQPEAAQAAPAPQGASIEIPIGITIAEAEQRLILATLRHYRHQKERTAAALGVSLKTLYNRLKQYAAERDIEE
jgi:DNA-binding NtrC family response regulator